MAQELVNLSNQLLLLKSTSIQIKKTVIVLLKDIQADSKFYKKIQKKKKTLEIPEIKGLVEIFCDDILYHSKLIDSELSIFCECIAKNKPLDDSLKLTKIWNGKSNFTNKKYTKSIIKYIEYIESELEKYTIENIKYYL